MPRLRPTLWLCAPLALALTACGGTPSNLIDAGTAAADGGTTTTDGGAVADGGAVTDGGPVTDGGAVTDGGYAWDLPGVDYQIDDLAPPISAPDETWTYVPVAESRCGNGSSTGIAVNLTQRSKRVLIFLAGGGACWEAAGCAAGGAVHIQDTMGEAQVLGEARSGAYATVFNRDDPQNPFRDASFVYVAYCTGDMHGGSRVHTYDWFGPVPIHHTGASNMHFFLRHLRATFRDADRVWLGGISAGGFGATLNWWRVQKVLPWARVDVFNDSGLVIDTAGDGRYGTMQQTWGLVFPPGCTDCGTKLSSTLSRSAELLAGPRRYAVMGYMRDQVIANYFGLSGDQVEARVNQMRSTATPNVKTFLLSGTGHVIYGNPGLSTSGGMSARAWSNAFATDDAAWDHAGP